MSLLRTVIRLIVYGTAITADTLIFNFLNATPTKNHKVEIGEFGKQTVIKQQNDFLKEDRNTFSYDLSEDSTFILNIIFNNTKFRPLNYFVETTSGFGGKSSAITEVNINKNQVKILRGRSIQRYEVIKHYYFDFIPGNITGRTTDKAKLGTIEKVLLRKTGTNLFATHDESGNYPEQSLYFLYESKTDLSMKYFTGILNSNLFQFIYINRLVTNKDSTPQLKKIDLDKLPIPALDLKKPADRQHHDTVVVFVEQLLALHPQLRAARLATEQNQLQARIRRLDQRLDHLVYRLYGLSYAEAQVVEPGLVQRLTEAEYGVWPHK